MRRRSFLTLAGAAVAFPRIAFAEQPAKMPRVVLASGAVPPAQIVSGGNLQWSAFIDAMARHGFVEGRSVQYDRYLTPANVEQAQLVHAILATSPDLIVWGADATAASIAAAMGETIPAVVWEADPVNEGLAADLTHPGGSFTGVAVTAGPDAEGKNLSLLAEAVPTAKTVAYLQSGSKGQMRPTAQPLLQSVTATAAKLGLSMNLVVVEAAGDPTDVAAAFKAITKNGCDLLLLGTDTTVNQNFPILASMALAAKLPTIASNLTFPEDGGLMGYGANGPDYAAKTADYAVQILGGAKPADLPILLPTAFDFGINLKTAKSIGVTIPPSLLVQATEVIE